jgi:hypothetical protein
LEQSATLGLDALWSPVSGTTNSSGTNYLILTPRSAGPGTPPPPGSLFFRLVPGP